MDTKTDIDKMIDALTDAQDHARKMYEANGRNDYDAGVVEGLKRAMEIGADLRQQLEPARKSEDTDLRDAHRNARLRQALRDKSRNLEDVVSALGLENLPSKDKGPSLKS